MDEFGNNWNKYGIHQRYRIFDKDCLSKECECRVLKDSMEKDFIVPEESVLRYPFNAIKKGQCFYVLYSESTLSALYKHSLKCNKYTKKEFFIHKNDIKQAWEIVRIY